MTRLHAASAPRWSAVHSGDRSVLKKSDVRRLIELGTGVMPSDTLVTALYRATCGHPERAAKLLRELVATVPNPTPAREYIFRQEGEYWTIAYESRVIRLRDTKGVRHLARLLRQPGRPVHVTELAGGSATTSAGLERARLAITKAIKAALTRIATAHPELGRHLAVTVRRGYVCVYLPDPGSAISWSE